MIITSPLKLALIGIDLLSPGHNLTVIQQDTKMGIAVVAMSEQDEATISHKAHEKGRCGGFEVLQEIPPTDTFSLSLAHYRNPLIIQSANILNRLKKQNQKSLEMFVRAPKITADESILDLVSQVDSQRLASHIEFLSGFENRYNKGAKANVAVVALRDRILEIVEGIEGVEVSLVEHSSTPQKSIKVRIPGTEHADEIVVLGGHLDSISGWFGSGRIAPGADDNASGVSSLLEALQTMAPSLPAQRTIEFIFYAGEESGLLGSAEIARAYKQEGADVIAVLQLDMTLFPGSGEFKLGSMTDFTSPWLRNYFSAVNTAYVGAEIIESRCGYGCSDHASWFRQGYPTLMPFEATFDEMNDQIHTEHDVINQSSNFEHAAMFSKIAISLALTLGNNRDRSP